MRLLARSAPPLPGATTADDVLQLGNSTMPTKAEKLLGTSSQLGRKRSRRKAQARPESPFDRSRKDEQKSLGTFQQTYNQRQGTMHDDEGLKTWPYTKPTQPKSHSYRDRLSGLLSHKGSSAASSRKSVRHESSSSTLRSYYDAAHQPLTISQQTSASAVRDMALRKGSPTVVDANRDSHSFRRPLKSALKKETSSITSNSFVDQQDRKKPKRLDLANLFPRPSATHRHMLSPSKITRSPSTMTNDSDYFSPNDSYTNGSRYDISKLTKTPSINSTSTTREKVFEKDIFDNTKRNVRRPPKGIQNWFDGFEISSDEEEKSISSVHELPAALPSTYSPWPAMNGLETSQDGRTTVSKGALRPRRPSEDSRMTVTTESHSSSRAPSRRKGESRLATSRLQDESVLSLSSEEDEDDGYVTEKPDTRQSLGVESDISAHDFVLQHAESVDVLRPTVPPRQLQHKKDTTHARPVVTSTAKDEQVSNGRSLRTPSQSTSTTDHAETASRKIQGILEYYSSPRSESHASQQSNRSSAYVENLDAHQTESSRLMAVTDEEMALLDMMRRKRAAMTQTSFAEGYKLALQDEEEERAIRRRSSHQAALKLLKKKDEDTRKRNNRISTDVRPEDLDNLQRLSDMKREGIDRAMKLERFLASEAPLEDIFPSPPTRESITSSRLSGELLTSKVYNPHSESQLSRRKSYRGSLVYQPRVDSNSDGVTSDGFMDKFLASSSSSGSALQTPKRPTTSVSERRKSRPSSRIETSYGDVPPIPERSASQHAYIENINRQPHARRLELQVIADQLFSPAPEDDFNASQTASTTGTRSLMTSPVPLDDLASFSATSRNSPLTPTFPILSASAVKVVGSDGSATPRFVYTAPERESSKLPRPVSMKSKAGSNRRKPPAIQTTTPAGGINRLSSVSSINSAGEDVRAAWVELGGGNDTYAPRRTRAR
ncbi:hypothetical protein K431DRAFT_316133 [Polychaeton citri CBS 116435]|uniref:Uncharacterized protein n=1 Tax=Polychaeton citri CBS 116435 TaxID=1314669 RepID=A0A9P4Q029_9PEZI|nr:hypothetical protein K431DRAFT_316133 [Polychaeton citri CBS 116435]